MIFTFEEYGSSGREVKLWESTPQPPLLLLFGGDTYYPNGGLEDCAAASNDGNDLDALTEYANERFGEPLKWWRIVDMRTGTTLLSRSGHEPE